MKARKLLRQIERRLELQARRDLAFIRLAERVFPPTTEQEAFRVFLPDKPESGYVRLLRAIAALDADAPATRKPQ